MQSVKIYFSVYQDNLVFDLSSNSKPLGSHPLLGRGTGRFGLQPNRILQRDLETFKNRFTRVATAYLQQRVNKKDLSPVRATFAIFSESVYNRHEGFRLSNDRMRPCD